MNSVDRSEATCGAVRRHECAVSFSWNRRKWEACTGCGCQAGRSSVSSSMQTGARMLVAAATVGYTGAFLAPVGGGMCAHSVYSRPGNLVSASRIRAMRSAGVHSGSTTGDGASDSDEASDIVHGAASVVGAPGSLGVGAHASVMTDGAVTVDGACGVVAGSGETGITTESARGS